MIQCIHFEKDSTFLISNINRKKYVRNLNLKRNNIPGKIE